MAENRYYTVTEDREVKIQASNPIEAAQLADRVFGGEGIISDESGRTRIIKPVRQRDLIVREDY